MVFLVTWFCWICFLRDLTYHMNAITDVMWLSFFFYPDFTGFGSREIKLTIWTHSLRRRNCGVFGDLVVAGFDSRTTQLTIWMHSLRRCDLVFLMALVLLDLLQEGFNLPYECTHWGDVIVVFLVTLELLDFLLEGFNLPYEYTLWGDGMWCFWWPKCYWICF